MADRVIVVDDDVDNIKTAGLILSKANIHVTGLKSGQALLDYVIQNGFPNLILLDIKMPGMDGFETLSRLREIEGAADVPVIILSADEREDTETRGLALGAIDFIKKPFVPDVLKLRVRHMLDLDRLQRNLAEEVERKTRDNEKLFIHVVSSLASAIDAKDTYTNGHSDRVAMYAREISKRYGYDAGQQGDIYIMGLLHDVGKIGVPDSIINKPSRLTDSEFEAIKKHPGMGAKILANITEMPALVKGAKWHHERYDGKGYPEGKAGEDIPLIARIICVADSFDAMNSNRVYRKKLSREHIINEIEANKGKQFDPKIADIMLDLIKDGKIAMASDK